MPTIDAARILADLHTLRGFGTYETGVHRPTFSDVDVQARHWFAGRLAEAGLEPAVDGIGSVFGWAPGDGPTVLAGSHLESQNHAGWLDGPLGCVYALEAARVLGGGVDVAAWCDEEGHFASLLGSASFVGLLDDDALATVSNRITGEPLADAVARAGFAGRPRRTFVPGRHKAYMEAHIEQGDTLESSGRRIGIVTAIVGIWQYRLTATGEQNHAGTTSMARRHDAGLALVRLLGAIDRRFPDLAGPRTVWTAGRMTFEPGAASVIPGRAEALFQIRDADPAILERLRAELFRLVAEVDGAGPCPVAVETLGESRPAVMDAGLQDAIERAAEARLPGGSLRLPSGAGHDAQHLARVMPSSMMFVPSIGGISHHWTENTSDADIVLGAEVFVDAVAAVLAG